jgi:hypothetical protein
MTQAPKRFGDPEVAFVFIPDDADEATVPLPSSDPVRLRARLVREPSATSTPTRDRPPSPGKPPTYRAARDGRTCCSATSKTATIS